MYWKNEWHRAPKKSNRWQYQIGSDVWWWKCLHWTSAAFVAVEYDDTTNAGHYLELLKKLMDRRRGDRKRPVLLPDSDVRPIAMPESPSGFNALMKRATGGEAHPAFSLFSEAMNREITSRNTNYRYMAVWKLPEHWTKRKKEYL